MDGSAITLDPVRELSSIDILDRKEAALVFSLLIGHHVEYALFIGCLSVSLQKERTQRT